MYEEDIALLEQHFVVMYSTRCNATDVNTCRILFANGAPAENIFPASATFRQHIFQAVL